MITPDPPTTNTDINIICMLICLASPRQMIPEKPQKAIDISIAVNSTMGIP